MIVNLSRIGKNGTGMLAYSESVLKALRNYEIKYRVLKTKGLQLGEDKDTILLPEFLTNSSKVSRLRPILWYIYMFFLGIDDYVLSTSHHYLRNSKHNIITIHDIRPYYYPDSVAQRIYFHLPRVCKHVDGIFTVSNTSKKCICDVYNVPSEKVKVLYNVIDVKGFKDLNSEKRERYLLVVGGTWKHKNTHEILINHKSWDNDYDLIIVAGSSDYKEYLKRLVSDLNLENKVKFYEDISKEKLISLYQNATALIFPSLMEGFGIPPMEALACGTPVICSDILIFHEILGEAALYFELGNSDSFMKAIRSLKDKDKIDNCIKIGKDMLQEYTEEKFQERVINGMLEIWPELKK